MSVCQHTQARVSSCAWQMGCAPADVMRSQPVPALPVLPAWSAVAFTRQHPCATCAGPFPLQILWSRFESGSPPCRNSSTPYHMTEYKGKYGVSQSTPNALAMHKVVEH